jgi:signal transduction histidine kinase
MAPETRRPRVTIRSALFLGFGLMVGIWLFAGYYATTRVTDVEDRAAAVNRRYTRAQDLLSSVRAQVLIGSVYVRDALLDPNPATGDDYRRQFERAYEAVDRALQRYEPVLDSPAERARVVDLRSEIDAFRTGMLEVLDSDRRRSDADPLVLLRTRVLPKREAVLQLSDEAQALNRAAYVQQRNRLTEIYRVLQQRMWQGLGLALAASFCIAVVATRHVGRLEDRIRRQSESEAGYVRDLQRLSAKLISAQEEERRSLARELHDEIGQVLTTLKMEFALASRTIEAAGGPAHVLEGARAITDGALQSVRDLSHGLHPALLDDLGLGDAVEWHLRGFGRRHGIQATLEQTGLECRLTRETELCAYRVVQEALTNVARHAHATRCRVSIARTLESVTVVVEDDGIGFRPDGQESAGRRGLGLVGIRERAAELGGTVLIESAPGRGTSVRVDLPARLRVDADETDSSEPARAFLPDARREAFSG